METEVGIMVYAPPRRKLTAEDYHRMGAAGVFAPDERVELLDGELYHMPPIGDGHIGTVNWLNFKFTRGLGERAVISPQNSFRLSDFSEPEPDIAVLRPRADFYRSGKATPADVLLLIEVAESSLDYGRRTKLPRYAAAGIIEVWIVNLVAEQIEVYHEPVGERYSVREVYQRGDTLAPAAFPDLAIRVDQILG